MNTTILYSSIKNYIETLDNINHVSYDEAQAENEAKETAYQTPAVFIKFGERKRDGLFWNVPFILRLEVKTLERVDTTLNLSSTFETHIKAYKGTNNERINMKGFKSSHKKGNAPIHLFDCEILQRA